MREVVLETLETHQQNVEELVGYLEISSSLNAITDPSSVLDLARDLVNALAELREEIEESDEDAEFDE